MTDPTQYPPGCPTADEITAAHRVVRWLTLNYVRPPGETWLGLTEGARCLARCGHELYDLELWRDDG